MGRLLDALRSDFETAPPAIPAILPPAPLPAGANNRRIAIIAEGQPPKTEGRPTPCATEQTGRLLAALRDEHLPDALLSRDDAEPSQLAALDGAEMRAYARALSRSATMDAGNVPDSYTQAALCEGCGPVWLWEGCPPRLKACPWCFRRKAGRAFQRPLVACGDCRHFLPDPINPADGAGACGLGRPYRKGEIGRWPGAQRECDGYRPRTGEVHRKDGVSLMSSLSVESGQ